MNEEQERRQGVEADKWYYDLGMLARQVEVNASSARRAHRRIVVLALFVLFVSLVLSLYSQHQNHGLQAVYKRQAIARYEGCLGGRAIIVRFNAQQDKLAAIEESQTVNPVLAKRRIDAYHSGRILPLPSCGTRPR